MIIIYICNDHYLQFFATLVDCPHVNPLPVNLLKGNSREYLIGWTQRRGLTPRQWRWEHKSAWTAKMQMELENIGSLVGLNGWLLDGPT